MEISIQSFITSSLPHAFSCVCESVHSLHCGPNVPTRIVTLEMFNVVGTKFGLGFKERRDLVSLRINEKCGDVICIL